MGRHRIGNAMTGFAAGALVTAPVIGVLLLGPRLGLPSVPFSVFEWLVRVLPGRYFHLRTRNNFARPRCAWPQHQQDAAKTVEETLAVTRPFIFGGVAGAAFFAMAGPLDARRVMRHGRLVAVLAGIALLAVTLTTSPRPRLLAASSWHCGFSGCCISGVGAWLAYDFPQLVPSRHHVGESPAPMAAAPAVSTATAVAAAPASAEIPRRPLAVEVVSRRRFLIRMGGLVATVVVLGAEVWDILRVEDSLNITGSAVAPIPFAQRDSPVPAGPRHPSRVHAGGRSLSRRHRPLAAAVDRRIVAATDHGLVAHPVTLTLEQLKRPTGTPPFVTLSCISNPVGGR